MTDDPIDEMYPVEDYEQIPPDKVEALALTLVWILAAALAVVVFIIAVVLAVALIKM